MRYYWTDERYQITCGKRVTYAVKMVDSCSRENGVLCTVTCVFDLVYLILLSGMNDLRR